MWVYSVLSPVLCIGMSTIRDTSEKKCATAVDACSTAENHYVVSAILHNHTLWWLHIIIKQLKELNAYNTLFLQMLSILDPSMQPSQPSSDHPAQLATLKTNQPNSVTTCVIPQLPLPAPYHVDGSIYPCIPLGLLLSPLRKEFATQTRPQPNPLYPLQHPSTHLEERFPLSTLVAIALPMPTTLTGTSVGLPCPFLCVARQQLKCWVFPYLASCCNCSASPPTVHCHHHHHFFSIVFWHFPYWFAL